VVEVLDQPALPGGREVKRRNQGGKQPDVADPDIGCGKAVMRCGVEPEREHLRVRGRDIGPSERFDPGLQELARFVLPVPEDLPEIAEPLRPTGRRRRQIVARDRNGEVGPQAELAAVWIGGEEHPLADVLAGKVEKRLCRL
jgi:hypothetical protein